MNTQQIITAIQKQAHKLRSLEEHILSDCHYYQETIKVLGSTAEPTAEQLLLLGAYLATYQLWQISQPEINHHKAIVAPAIPLPDCLESKINTHFSPAE